MTFRLLFLVVSIGLFLAVGFSAFSDNVNVNEMGFLGFGLASFAGSFLSFTDRRIG